MSEIKKPAKLNVICDKIVPFRKKHKANKRYSSCHSSCACFPHHTYQSL